MTKPLSPFENRGFVDSLSRCFQRLLLNAGVSPDAAETEAFSMALAVRPETFEALKKYLAMP